MLARCAAGAESGKGIREMDEKEPEYKKRSFFECFPYVCPEPVLVKCSFLCINGRFSRRFFGSLRVCALRLLRCSGLMQESSWVGAFSCLSRSGSGKRSASVPVGVWEAKRGWDLNTPNPAGAKNAYIFCATLYQK